jgi:hypothetical protein
LYEQLNASCFARLTLNETGFFQGQHHLVHRRCGHLEVPTHIGFRRRAFEDPGIGVNEGQVLALQRRELWRCGRRLVAKRLIHLSLTCISSHQEAQMNIRYHVELSQFERQQLNALLSGGRHAARRLKRAQILLAANEGVSDAVIAATLNVSGSTIYRTKRRLVEANLEGALSEETRPGVARKLAAEEEALRRRANERDAACDRRLVRAR